jgi:hypothetical protein
LSRGKDKALGLARQERYLNKKETGHVRLSALISATIKKKKNRNRANIQLLITIFVTRIYHNINPFFAQDEHISMKINSENKQHTLINAPRRSQTPNMTYKVSAF